MTRRKLDIFAHTPFGKLGDQVEAQFDRMDRDLSHIRPRQIKEYNTIVYMTGLMRKGDR